MLKEIRRTPIINKIVRKLLKTWGRTSDKIYKKLSARWRTSGVIDCEFDSIRFKIYDECDDGLTSHFYYQNQEYHESQDLKVFLLLAKASQVIVDIGANTGLFSTLSGKVNPNAKIYAIEPYLSNYNRLLKNLEINNIQNVECVNIGFGEENSSVTMSVPKNEGITDVSSMNTSFPKFIYPEVEWKEILVEVKTVDQFAKTLKQRINLIKCDVESYEMSVFKGAEFTLQTDRPTILFECFLDEVRRVFFNEVLNKNTYYLYLVLKEGVVRLDNGFDYNNTGLNFILSPIKTSECFISHQRLRSEPQQLLLLNS